MDRNYITPRVGQRVLVTTSDYRKTPGLNDVLVIVWSKDGDSFSSHDFFIEGQDESRIFRHWILYADEFKIIEDTCPLTDEEIRNAKPWKTMADLDAFLKDRL